MTSPAVEEAFATLTGDHKSGNATLPSNGILDAGSCFSISLGGVDVKLVRPGDQQSEGRQARALRIAALIGEQLGDAFPNKDATSNDNQVKLQSYARVLVASEGSRRGRFWAAELGYGLSKLVVSWILLATTKGKDGKEEVTLGGRRVYEDNGGCGFLDMFSSTVGDDSLNKNAQVFVRDVLKEVNSLLARNSV